MSTRPLTTRERQVLDALAAGLSVRRICQQLYIDESTVKTHVKSLYAALGATSAGQAVHLAHMAGILAAPEGVCCRVAVREWLRDAADKIATEEGTS